MPTTTTKQALIPLLDLQPLQDGNQDGIQLLASELKAALEEIGFFSVINHGVSWSLVEL